MNAFEADLSRLNQVRVRLKDARKYGLAVRLDDAVFLVEFIDKLWKEYTHDLRAPETGEGGYCRRCATQHRRTFCPECGLNLIPVDVNTPKAVDQRAIDANALADAHRMYEAEHGHPFSESEG